MCGTMGASQYDALQGFLAHRPVLGSVAGGAGDRVQQFHHGAMAVLKV